MSDHKIEYKVEHNWGGEDTWYTKGKRWANKQKFPLNHLALGVLEWLWKLYVDERVKQEMESVDRQAEAIVEQWEKEDELNRPKAEIVEEGLFGEEGWSISISNPVVERRSQETDGRMGSGGNEKGLGEKLPDPWDDPLM